MRKYLLLILFITALACSTDGDTQPKIVTDDDGNMEEVDTSANKKGTGDAANDLLSDTNFESLVLEIIHVEEVAPTTGALDNLKAFLEDRLNKPGGIIIEQKAIPSPGKAQYSITDIRDLEDLNRTKYNENNTIAVSGIYIDGEYSENTENGSVLGVAYRNTSFVIFQETLNGFSSQPLAPSQTTLETVVLNHEFGHLLGLVNVGTPLQSDHQDVEHGSHCNVESCLMFWTAETGEGLLNMITGGSVPPLDSQCVADLRANGGK